MEDSVEAESSESAAAPPVMPVCRSGVLAATPAARRARLSGGRRQMPAPPRTGSARCGAAGGCRRSDRVNFLFADARSLYDDAIEMLDQGKIRNAAEKAWGATKRATDALVLARHGEEPQAAGQARRALLRLSTLDPAFDILQGQYHTRAGSCTSTASTTGTANRSRRWPT